MFKPLQHIECIDNTDESRLVVGAFYSVKDVWRSGKEIAIEVYGHEGVMFSAEYFSVSRRRPTISDFDRAFPEVKH